MPHGRRKMTLREFTRERPSQDDEKRFREAMNSESDLMVAIVSAIEVEYLLEQIIIGKLKRSDDDTIDILTKDNGALATFFSKIGLAYALKIIDGSKMEYLNVIRKIRNAFAHSRKDISFSNSLIMNEMASLKLPNQKHSKLYRGIKIVKELAAVKPNANNSNIDQLALIGRAAYVILAMHLVAYFLAKQKISLSRIKRFRNSLGVSGATMAAALMAHEKSSKK
jgi:DNA-binding MltR family transcriptional regulator